MELHLTVGILGEAAATKYMPHHQDKGLSCKRDLQHLLVCLR